MAHHNNLLLELDLLACIALIWHKMFLAFSDTAFTEASLCQIVSYKAQICVEPSVHVTIRVTFNISSSTPKTSNVCAVRNH